MDLVPSYTYIISRLLPTSVIPCIKTFESQSSVYRVPNFFQSAKCSVKWPLAFNWGYRYKEKVIHLVSIFYCTDQMRTLIISVNNVCIWRLSFFASPEKKAPVTSISIFHSTASEFIGQTETIWFERSPAIARKSRMIFYSSWEDSLNQNVSLHTISVISVNQKYFSSVQFKNTNL